MELKCISKATANLIMDAILCAWMELVGENDEKQINNGVEWTQEAFVRFCDVSGIDLVEKEEKRG